MNGLNCSNRRVTRTGVLRSGGTADSNACRTVLRCTLCRSASCRIDNPSTRSSRRIAANSSTLDPISAPPFVVTDVSMTTLGWGQIKPSQGARRVAVGPHQTVTASGEVEPNRTVLPGPDQAVTAKG